MPTCVEMVLAYHDHAIDSRRLRRILESTPIGTPGFKIRNLAEHGCDVLYAPATDERVLVDALSANTPPIVLLMTVHLPYWEAETAHAVVVVGFEDDQVLINDPAFSQQTQRISFDAFMLAWSDFDYVYAVIEPNR